MAFGRRTIFGLLERLCALPAKFNLTIQLLRMSVSLSRLAKHWEMKQPVCVLRDQPKPLSMGTTDSRIGAAKQPEALVSRPLLPAAPGFKNPGYPWRCQKTAHFELLARTACLRASFVSQFNFRVGCHGHASAWP